jgi:hypothetical protein
MHASYLGGVVVGVVAVDVDAGPTPTPTPAKCAVKGYATWFTSSSLDQNDQLLCCFVHPKTALFTTQPYPISSSIPLPSSPSPSQIHSITSHRCRRNARRHSLGTCSSPTDLSDQVSEEQAVFERSVPSI